MAATRFEAAIPSNSFLFDIYTDGQPAQPAPTTLNFPSGPCHFADTSPGANGARCGCRRFYSRQPVVRGPFGDNSNPDEALWCMCAHHACFHDLHQPGQVPAPVMDGVTVAGQENERPRTNREPLSPVQDIGTFQMPSSLGTTLDLDLLDFPASSFSLPVPAGTIVAPEVNHGQNSSMPDTLDWDTILQSQPARPDTAPVNPSHSLLGARPPSTASSSQARYLHPFAGRGLQTLSGACAGQTQPAPPMEPTPGGAPASVVKDVSKMDMAHVTQETENVQESPTTHGVTSDTFQHITKVVHGHEQRLDRLENVSFAAAHDECQAKHEECEEKHDHTDLRVTELESRVEEVERMLNSDNSTLGSTRRLVRKDDADDATASVVSVATTTTSAADRSELYSQLEALKAQISYLQASSAPSYNNPWELEVVFLPFPLKGVWIEAGNFPMNTYLDALGNTGDEWTQMPNTATRSGPDPQSPNGGAAFGDVHGSDWLLPRACAPGRMIDSRLRSRGFVKTVTVRGADARSVQLAINTAFSDVLRMSDLSKTSRALVHLNAFDEGQGLPAALGPHQAWVPLRKIHKDSRLRFLNPSEMVTPALWDYSFLTSSVVMKASGTQRLYITQREAYLQDHPVGFKAFESGWTWQRLRVLTRVYPDSQSSNGDVPEADAMEECWTWNDRLDEPPSSLSSSSSLRQVHANRSSARRSSGSSSQQYFTGIQSPILSTSPKPPGPRSPLVAKEVKSQRPSRLPTGSLPPSAPIAGSGSIAKRRISGHGAVNSHPPYERRVSPIMTRPSPLVPLADVTASAAGSFGKRRQATKSPGLTPRNTPRWTQRMMSRTPSVPPHTMHGYDGRSERTTTPFQYNTPFSNAPPEPVRANGRVPVTTEYYSDNDENMEDDHGSSTDPYDSEMTNEADADDAGQRYRDIINEGLFTDDDGDIDIYKDEPDNLDNIETDADSQNEYQYHGANTATRYLVLQDHAHGQAYFGRGTLPEDEPQPGIEDHMSEEENFDPVSSSDGDSDIELGEFSRHRDALSDVSSQPSEYPSTQPAWRITDATETLSERRRQSSTDGAIHGQAEMEMESGVGFHIHEDTDPDRDGGDSLWER